MSVTTFVYALLALLLFCLIRAARKRLVDMDYLGIDGLDFLRARFDRSRREHNKWLEQKAEDKIEEKYELLGHRLRNAYRELTASDEYQSLVVEEKDRVSALVDFWSRVFAGELYPPASVKIDGSAEANEAPVIRTFAVRFADVIEEHKRLQDIIQRWDLYQNDAEEDDDDHDDNETSEENP